MATSNDQRRFFSESAMPNSAQPLHAVHVSQIQEVRF